MPQFAVYRNPGRNPDIPFVVQIQSSRLERVAGRVVMPLVRRSTLCRRTIRSRHICASRAKTFLPTRSIWQLFQPRAGILCQFSIRDSNKKRRRFPPGVSFNRIYRRQ